MSCNEYNNILSNDEENENISDLKNKDSDIQEIDTRSGLYYDEDLSFGLVPEMPIYTSVKKGVDGEIEYLNNLRTSSGEKVKWNYRVTTSIAEVNGWIDVFDIFLLTGKKYATIYINRYGSKISTKAPNGFAEQNFCYNDDAWKRGFFIWDIINIFPLMLPIILSKLGMDNYYYTDDLFGTIIGCGVVAVFLKLLGVIKFRKSLIVRILTVCSIMVMTLPLFAEDLWYIDEQNLMSYASIFIAYMFISEAYKLVSMVFKRYCFRKSKI